jgi:long-chain acyl-CoA synthetase
MIETVAQSKFTPTRIPLTADEPTTLPEVYERVLRDYPKPDTLNYKRDGVWHSIPSADMLRRAKAIAMGLNSQGVRHGDRVAIISESCIEWVLADQGCLFAGAVTVPIYPTLTPPQVRYILEDCVPKVLFVETLAKFDEIRDVAQNCKSISDTVIFRADSVPGSKLLTLAELERRGRERATTEPQVTDELVHPRPDDLATIIYTSGTTGEPKGVMLSHANMVSNLIDSSNHLEFGAKDSALSVLPLSHSFERQAMNMYLHHGMSVYFGELETLGDYLREVKPTVFVGVPRIYEKILARVQDRAMAKGKLNAALVHWAVEVGKSWAQQISDRKRISFGLSLQHKFADLILFEKLRNAMGGRIRILVSGGAALSNEVSLAFLGAGLPIVQGYGLTETSPVISAGQLHDIRIGTSGKPIRNVEVRIAADGEIETRGPHVMQGYWHKPDETSAVISDDGWFKTGDIGSLDADGFLAITDRKKELLKTSGGKYIAPQPIEQLIKGSRFVNQVVVIGNDRKFASALIVPDWDQIEAYAKYKGIDNLNSRADFCHCPRIINLFERQIAARTQSLAQFEKIKKIALLDHEFTVEGGEMTPTLKVKRRVIDEKYRVLINQLYADDRSMSDHGWNEEVIGG